MKSGKRPAKHRIRRIDEYASVIGSDGFHKFIDSIPNQPAAMLKTLMILLEYRLKTGVTGKRFLECVDRCKRGLHFTMEIPEEELSAIYAKSKVDSYDPFMAAHEYILENYFVNFAFQTLFPLGQQMSTYGKSASLVPRTIFTEYMPLTLRYALLKSLLVGMAGCTQEPFGTQEVLKLIQSFDKNVGRDIPYLQRLLQFLTRIRCSISPAPRCSSKTEHSLAKVTGTPQAEEIETIDDTSIAIFEKNLIKFLTWSRLQVVRYKQYFDPK